MSKQIKRREPGKQAFPFRPRLVLVPPAQEVDRPAPKVEPSQEVREILRELSRRHTNTRDTDTPDAA